MKAFFRFIFRPLKSRKVCTAIATVLVAALSDWGLDLDPEVILSIMGTGIAIILGIAHEDNGTKIAGSQPAEKTPLRDSLPAVKIGGFKKPRDE